MIGAGHQAQFQLRAAAEQRDFERVVAWNAHPDMLPKLGEVAKEIGLPFETVTQEELGARADVIVSITSAHEALIGCDQVKPGTHVACMGTDTVGKQEMDPALFARATVFTDEVRQSITLGEAQHAVAAGLIAESDITPIGAVINGSHPGRSSDDEITVFDGTGGRAAGPGRRRRRRASRARERGTDRLACSAAAQPGRVAPRVGRVSDPGASRAGVRGVSRRTRQDASAVSDRSAAAATRERRPASRTGLTMCSSKPAASARSRSRA